MPRALLFLVFGLYAVCASAYPRISPGVARIARNDGDSNNPFAVTCTATAWTVVGSSLTTLGSAIGPSRKRRRAMTIHTLATVTYAVCLSSGGGSGVPCGDTTVGYELGSAWASVSIYDQAVWYCRSRTGGSTAVKGAEHYESGDERD